MLNDVVTNFTLELTRDQFVDFRNQDGHLWNEFNKTLRHENDTIVLSHLSSLADDVCDIGCDLRQSLVLCLDLLTDKDAVDARSEGTLEGNVGGGTTHQANKVVVLFGGYDVRAQVADSL